MMLIWVGAVSIDKSTEYEKNGSENCVVVKEKWYVPTEKRDDRCVENSRGNPSTGRITRSA